MNLEMHTTYLCAGIRRGRRTLPIIVAVACLSGCYVAPVTQPPPAAPIGQPAPVAFFFGVVLELRASGQGQQAMVDTPEVAVAELQENQVAAASGQTVRRSVTSPSVTRQRTPTRPTTVYRGGGYRGGGYHGGYYYTGEIINDIFGVLGAANEAAIAEAEEAQLPTVEYTVVLNSGPTIDLTQIWYTGDRVLAPNERAAVRVVSGMARAIPEDTIPPYLHDRLASGPIPPPTAAYLPPPPDARIELVPVMVNNAYHPSWMVDVQ